MVAAPDYTTDGLITSVKTKYLIPNSQTTFQDADILLFLDEELRSTIIPLISSVRGDYWLTNYDQPVTGAASYTIPVRGAGGILVDVVFVDPNGNEMKLTQLSPSQVSSTQPFGYQLPLYSFGYYIQDDQVVLYPSSAVQATAYTLRQKFLRRPNNLALMADCAQVTAINGSVVTVNAVPSDWTTSVTFDVIQNFPQFKSISDGLGITLISNLDITLASIPTGLAVGMWLCPTTMSCIPQIPYEAFSLLVQRGIVRLAESLGDTQGSQVAEKRSESLAQGLVRLIAPRVQQGAKKIVNPNNPPSWGGPGSCFLR